MDDGRSGWDTVGLACLVAVGLLIHVAYLGMYVCEGSVVSFTIASASPTASASAPTTNGALSRPLTHPINKYPDDSFASAPRDCTYDVDRRLALASGSTGPGTSALLHLCTLRDGGDAYIVRMHDIHSYLDSGSSAWNKGAGAIRARREKPEVVSKHGELCGNVRGWLDGRERAGRNYGDW